MTKLRRKAPIAPIWGLASAGVFLALWGMVAVLVESWRDAYFPSPVAAGHALLQLVHGREIYEHTIWLHTGQTLARWATGYTGALLIGSLAGAAMALSSVMRRLFMPWFSILQLIPGLAWVPVALLLFGIGNSGTIFMVSAVAVAPVALATQGGMRNIPRPLLDAAQILGARGFYLVRKVMLPHAFTTILQGWRAALGNSWRVLIAAEMIVGSGVGLGYVIVQSRWSLRFAEAFAVIAIIVFWGLVLEYGVFRPLENLWLRKTGGNHD